MNKFELIIRQTPILRALFLTKQGNIVIAQDPNWPLYVYIVSKVVTLIWTGYASRYVNDVADAAIILWCLLEIISGVNLFRRLLGSAVLFGLAISWHIAPIFW